jgi:hypothetical protein
VLLHTALSRVIGVHKLYIVDAICETATDKALKTQQLIFAAARCTIFTLPRDRHKFALQVIWPLID